jgi:hypothetical protein
MASVPFSNLESTQMSENNNDFDVFDPLGMLKTMRSESMDAWAKMMVQFVNNEAYAHATGKMLDAWLSNSGPFRKLIENTMTQTLANLSMPSREEVTRLAERLTNIEMRLDDLDAKLDDVLAAARTAGAKKPRHSEEAK